MSVNLIELVQNKMSERKSQSFNKEIKTTFSINSICATSEICPYLVAKLATFTS